MKHTIKKLFICVLLAGVILQPLVPLGAALAQEAVGEASESVSDAAPATDGAVGDSTEPPITSDALQENSVLDPFSHDENATLRSEEGISDTEAGDEPAPALPLSSQEPQTESLLEIDRQTTQATSPVPTFSANRELVAGYSKEVGIRVDENSGAAMSSYPIIVPQDRGGLLPQLALTYNSGNQAADSFFGMGWDMPMASITRDARLGTNRVHDSGIPGEVELVLSWFGSSYDLVWLDVPSGLYGVKNETSGIFFKITAHADNSWTVTDTSGMMYVFGKTSQSRIESGGLTYSWKIEEIQDTNANVVRFEYF